MNLWNEKIDNWWVGNEYKTVDELKWNENGRQKTKNGCIDECAGPLRVGLPALQKNAVKERAAFASAGA